MNGWNWFVWWCVLAFVVIGCIIALRLPQSRTKTDNNGVVQTRQLPFNTDILVLFVLWIGWLVLIFPGGIITKWTWISLIPLTIASVIVLVRLRKTGRSWIAIALGITAAVMFLGAPLWQDYFFKGDPEETVTVSEPAPRTRTPRTPAPPPQASPTTPPAACEGWNLEVLNPDDQLFASDIPYPSDKVAEDAFRTYIDTVRVDPENWQLALSTYLGLKEDLNVLINTDRNPNTGCASGVSRDIYEGDLVNRIPEIINVDDEGCVIVTYFSFDGPPITCSDDDAPVQPNTPATTAAPAPAPAPAPAAPAPAPGTTRPPAPAPAPAPAPQAPAPPPAAPAPAPQPSPAPPAAPRPLEPNVTQQSASGPASTQETAPSGPEQANPDTAPGAGSGPAGGNVTD